MSSLLPEYSSLPKSPGVYLFRDQNNEILYIGKAKSLRDRVSQYFRRRDTLLPKTQAMVGQIAKIDHIEVQSEIDALILEANLVRKNSPKYNSDLKDDKSYPRIEITIKEKIPIVRLVRREEDPRAKYFGPYPVGTEAGKLLRFLRRVFPYFSQTHPANRVCFRSHLGLCPCASVFGSEAGRLSYRREINKLSEFLSGKRDSVQKTLEKEMANFAKVEEFEKAQETKEKLEKIAWLTAPRTNPFEYEINPDLMSEKRERRVADLEKFLGISQVRRIECYDISNLGGTLATGAMVVFTEGSADKREYRRFKIKTKNTPDDPQMIHEVLSRRLKRKKEGWTLPELIIVDGGATQLGAARRALAENELSIPVIGLAKKLEEIYLESDVKIDLPEGSPVLQLLQQMRDEAHRFSRSYHFLLRRKKLLS